MLHCIEVFQECVTRLAFGYLESAIVILMIYMASVFRFKIAFELALAVQSSFLSYRLTLE